MTPRMKREYEQPLVNYVALVPVGMLAASATGDGPGAGIGSGKVNPDEAWANEYRNTWSEMWSGF